MPEATNEQVQAFVNERVRPLSELVRKTMIMATDFKDSFGDIKLNVNNPATTWADNRTDGPPFLLTPSDIMECSRFVDDLLTFKDGTFADLTAANRGGLKWPKMLQACVRPPEVTTG